MQDILLKTFNNARQEEILQRKCCVDDTAILRAPCHMCVHHNLEGSSNRITRKNTLYYCAFFSGDAEERNNTLIFVTEDCIANRTTKRMNECRQDLRTSTAVERHATSNHPHFSVHPVTTTTRPRHAAGWEATINKITAKNKVIGRAVQL